MSLFRDQAAHESIKRVQEIDAVISRRKNSGAELAICKRCRERYPWHKKVTFCPKPYLKSILSSTNTRCTNVVYIHPWSLALAVGYSVHHFIIWVKRSTVFLQKVYHFTWSHSTLPILDQMVDFSLKMNPLGSVQPALSTDTQSKMNRSKTKQFPELAQWS